MKLKECVAVEGSLDALPSYCALLLTFWHKWLAAVLVYIIMTTDLNKEDLSLMLLYAFP